MSNWNPAVEDFLNDLDHPQRDNILRIRNAILESNPEITEQIKWKAPSFCHGDDDRVTFRFHPLQGVQLIFHRGVAVKDASNFAFTDDSGLMKWAAKDRATVTLVDDAEIKRQLPELIGLINRWMSETSDL